MYLGKGLPPAEPAQAVQARAAAKAEPGPGELDWRR